MKKLLSSILFPMLLTAVFNDAQSQNVGIGTATPGYKLDVSGRMRIRHETQSAGIWLDASNSVNRAFIGMVNDDHVGLYGNGSSWRLAMNVNNGNIGVSTTSPTASLDVSGTMRYRGSGFPNLPEPGALLTSIDNAGNAQWQRPVVFKTNGLTADIDVPGWQWTKVNFASSNLEVNEGFFYDPFNSRFNAPVRGIYHFDAKLFLFATTAKTYMRIVVARNGTVIKEYRDQQLLCDEYCPVFRVDGYWDFDFYPYYRSFSVSVDTPLEKNDQVWVEVYCSAFKDSDGDPVDGTVQVQKEANSTWFGGHLVYRY